MFVSSMVCVIRNWVLTRNWVYTPVSQLYNNNNNNNNINRSQL
jgi:hypothetical protein